MTEDYKPEQEFFVGIDSDGCVFDSMELKHKECFIPAFINHYDLQGVSKYARETSEFVNLYSQSRGCNRFLGLVEQLDWLRRRPEVQSRGVKVPMLTGLNNWVEQETKLGNPTLAKMVEATGDPDLTDALKWVARSQRGDRSDGPRCAALPSRQKSASSDLPSMLICSSFLQPPTQP